MMRRREFITLIGGAAAVWPLAAHGQEPTVPVVGYLGDISPETRRDRLDAFRKGLADTGYVEGHNVTIEYRWARGRYERLPALATDLVRSRVAVIVAPGNPNPALAAKAATQTVPIVFMIGSDPVEAGLVASLARPGGNITGTTAMIGELFGKRLEMLHELVPAAMLVARLTNPDNSAYLASGDLEQATARRLGLHLLMVHARREDEFEAAFATLVQQGAGGLEVSADPLFTGLREQIVELAAAIGARDLCVPRGGRGRRADQLWERRARYLPKGRNLCRPHPQGREARRSAGHATDQVRTRNQPQDRQSTRHPSATLAARPRRRGDRVIRRREFITALGGAAVAWPIVARAQPSVRVRRIGIFMNLASDDAEGQSRNAAFLQGLQELGWAVGRNVRIDYRWGASNSDPDRMRKDAAELLALAPDVILATTAPIVVALQQVSRTVPIAFATVIDPVGAGVVASLARPGGEAVMSRAVCMAFSCSFHNATSWQQPIAISGFH